MSGRKLDNYGKATGLIRSNEGLHFSLLDQFSSAVVTGAIGAILAGATGGSLLPIVGAAVAGGFLGTLGGRATRAALLERTYILGAIKYGSSTVRLLEDALLAEFEMSALRSGTSIGKEIGNRLVRLEALGLKIPQLGIKEVSDTEITIQANLDNVKSWCRKLAEIDRIRIGVPAIHPSIVATVMYMDELITRHSSAGKTLLIDFSPDRGISLLEYIKISAPFDFIAVADSPFYHWDQSPLRELYHPILPVSSDVDVVLTPKSTVGDSENLKLILFRKGTSAEDVARYTQPKNVASLPHLGVSADDRPIYLESGIGIATIAPYSQRLLADPQLALKQVGKTLQTPTSLYAEKHWFTPALESYRLCFTNLFVQSWLNLQSKPQRAIQNLLRNDQFMRVFTRFVSVS